jgi:hypothetical protein
MWGKKAKEPAKSAKNTKKTTAVKGTKTKHAATKKGNNEGNSKKITKMAKTDSKEEGKFVDYETIFKVYLDERDHKEVRKASIDSEGIVNLAQDWKLDLGSSLELLVFMWY